MALAVGDASGKGLEAAARTITVNDALRAFLRSSRGADVACVLARLNDFVCEGQDETEGVRFVTLALVILDTATGEAQFGSAGAEPPLIVRANGAVEEVKAHGFPLGIAAGEVYQTRTVGLLPGDTVVLATDGITEARRRDGEFLGYESLVALAREAAGGASPVEQAAHAILEGVRAFAEGGLRDDVCLLLARRCQGDQALSDPLTNA